MLTEGKMVCPVSGEELVDTLAMCAAANGGTPEVRLYEHGFVRLVDIMPRLVPAGMTGDSAIVEGARKSVGKVVSREKIKEDRIFTRFLYRSKHSSPFEQAEVKFLCRLPIFVARQWVRHRTAHLNEFSARYAVIPDEFWVPEVSQLRKQSLKNKQGSDGCLDEGEAGVMSNAVREYTAQGYAMYLDMLAAGVAREVARSHLPVSIHTEWVWKIDVHNFLHFLGLRTDLDAQEEIRDYANAMLNLIRPAFPWSVEAFDDYHPNRGGMFLSRMEVEAIRAVVASLGRQGRAVGVTIDTESPREHDEWREKAKRFNLDVPGLKGGTAKG